MIFQSAALFDSMTVLENVMFPLDMFSDMNETDRVRRAKFCLERVNLRGAEEKFPGEISGGMQKRVAIARALCMRPDVIYFDEATSALDPKLTADMRDLIRRLSSQGMAVGIVTHEMGFARDVSDRVAFLYDGSIAEEGSPDQVLANPKTDFVREFLSRAED